MTELDEVHLAAADWLTRLREPNVSLDDTLAWQSWMAQDPRHARAFARMEEVSSVLRAMPKPPLPRAERLARPRRLTFALAAALAAMAVAVAWALHGPAPLILQTAVGENRTERLDDGSTIILGGNSRVEVALSKKIRRIDLDRGEAFFTVARDTSRPFKVRAGSASVVALGTEFNVRKRQREIVVSVVEGRVMVEPDSRLVPAAILREFKPKLVAVKLDAGQQTTAGAAGVELPTSHADLSAATAWQRGRLSFRLQPLKDVLEDVNRYAPKPVTVEDDRIGALRVTGSVVNNNVAGWVASLESALSVEAIEEPTRIVLRRQPSP